MNSDRRLVVPGDINNMDAEAAWELAAEREMELATGGVVAVPLELAIERLEARFPG